MKKLIYEVPETEVIKVKFEKNILSDPATMNGWVAGDYKTAGDHNNFDPGNQHGVL